MYSKYKFEQPAETTDKGGVFLCKDLMLWHLKEEILNSLISSLFYDNLEHKRKKT